MHDPNHVISRLILIGEVLTALSCLTSLWTYRYLIRKLPPEETEKRRKYRNWMRVTVMLLVLLLAMIFFGGGW